MSAQLCSLSSGSTPRSARCCSSWLQAHGYPGYVGGTIGEIGFLRGIWLDGSRRLVAGKPYSAELSANTDTEVPDQLVDGIRLDRVSFAYPGADRLALQDVTLHLPAGAVVAVVGENGAGKSTLVKLLAKMYMNQRRARS